MSVLVWMRYPDKVFEFCFWCLLFQPHPQHVQSHWAVPMELLKRDRQRHVCRTQCKRDTTVGLCRIDTISARKCVTGGFTWSKTTYLLNSSSACAPAVSSRGDQPHVEVGGCMEGAGLPSTQCFFRRARGEWTLAEICPLGTAWSLFLARSRPKTPTLSYVIWSPLKT